MVLVRFFSLSLLIFIFSLGCSNSPQNSDVKAAPLIKDSFTAIPVANGNSNTSSEPQTNTQPPATTSPNSATPDVLTAQDNYNLGLKKTALEKEFLLNASIITQEGAATSTGLKGRIVAFRRRGDSVFMLEATQGHVVTDDLPATLILAELPIIKETDDTLTLDFNKGMQQVFVTKDMHASDMEGKTYGSSVAAAKVSHSFIQDIKLDGSLMEIRQIAQIDAPSQNGSDSLPTYEVRYFISPYLPSATFQRRETSDFSNVGFFEVAPVLETGSGRSTTYIAHWDITNPVVYYVSSNTPPEFVEAVKEGVLYWNAAFGHEVVKVAMAPSGVTAPDPQYNIIQWVPYDSAGYAYADALMDPRTGEILHAQVYLTSAFSALIKARYPAILRRLLVSGKPATTTGPSIGLSFLDSSRVCEMAPDPNLVTSLQNAAQSGADDSAFLRIAQDYVRATVAHEIGHTLGLRHNFAGSLATGMTLTDRNTAFSNYVLKGTQPPQTPLTSSYMDYLVLEDDVLTARQIENIPSARAYDKNAIQWGYMGQAMPKDTPLFCSEAQVGVLDDCVLFDSGKDPVVSDNTYLLSGMKNLAVGFAEAFITARAPVDKRDQLPVEKVVIDPVASLKPVLDYYQKQLHWFQNGNRALSIERLFPAVGPLDQKDIDTAKFTWIKKQVDGLGGVDKVLFSLLPATDRPAEDIQKEGNDALATYLAQDSVRNGIGPDGSKYSLTDAEVSFIKTQGQVFFSQVEDLIVSDLLDLLVAAPFVDTQTDMNDQVEKRLAAVAQYIITAQGALIPNTGKLVVNDFKYKMDVRIKAVKLLAGSLGSAADWSLDGRLTTFGQLVSIVSNSTGQDISKIDDTALARPLRGWVQDQEGILKAIQKIGDM